MVIMEQLLEKHGPVVKCFLFLYLIQHKQYYKHLGCLEHQRQCPVVIFFAFKGASPIRPLMTSETSHWIHFVSGF